MAHDQSPGQTTTYWYWKRIFGVACRDFRHGFDRRKALYSALQWFFATGVFVAVVVFAWPAPPQEGPGPGPVIEAMLLGACALIGFVFVLAVQFGQVLLSVPAQRENAKFRAINEEAISGGISTVVHRGAYFDFDGTWFGNKFVFDDPVFNLDMSSSLPMVRDDETGELFSHVRMDSVEVCAPPFSLATVRYEGHGGTKVAIGRVGSERGPLASAGQGDVLVDGDSKISVVAVGSEQVVSLTIQTVAFAKSSVPPEA